MVRAQRGKKLQRPKKTERHDEDDPEAYKNMPVPDKKSSQYTKDKIDEFHDEKIAKLLASGVGMESDSEEIDDEEEVMALDDSEEEDDDEEIEEEGTDMESDLEGKKDEDLPNEMAWGKKKKMFYDSDYVTIKGKSNEELETEEQEEEEEAKSIQKRLAANLSEEDYDLNLFQEFAGEDEKDENTTIEKEERIVKDLKEMSQKEKMKLLKKESPELLELIQDFKAKITELKDELQPLVQMIKDGKIPPGKGADYIKTKQQLYLNYCTNISFYLVLKAKRIPAHNHPVIERLLTYRNLINELGAVDARLAPEFRRLLAGEARGARAEGKKTRVCGKKEKDSDETMPEVEEDSDSDLDEEAALRFYRETEERLKLKRKSKDPHAEELAKVGDVEDELDPDAKRGITYQVRSSSHSNTGISVLKLKTLLSRVTLYRQKPQIRAISAFERESPVTVRFERLTDTSPPLTSFLAGLRSQGYDHVVCDPLSAVSGVV